MLLRKKNTLDHFCSSLDTVKLLTLLLFSPNHESSDRPAWNSALSNVVSLDLKPCLSRQTAGKPI